MDSDIPADDNHDILDGDDHEDSDKQATGITEPRDTDVLCGRGGAALRHPGNQTYRKLVNLNKGLYITCLKTEKLKISRSIVAAIREQNGRFLEKDNNSSSEHKGTWYDIGDKKAIEKTSQALREGQPKLRQKIAESIASNNATTLPADINPHCLPYGAGSGPQQNLHAGPSMVVSTNSFQLQSVHSMGSGSFSMGESGLLSTGDVASLHSIPYNNTGMSTTSLGSGMQPQVPPFLQQQDQSGMMLSNNAALMVAAAAARQRQEYQVQRSQASDINPHHRDIALSNNGQYDLLQAEMLQRLSLHDMSVTSGNTNNSNNINNNTNLNSGGFQLQPSNSAVSAFGVSVRTVDSNAIDTVNTFNSLNNNCTSGMTPAQRLALARELGIDESQLSLLTDFTPSAHNTTSASIQSMGNAEGMSVDSFKRALSGLPHPMGSAQNIGNNNSNNHNNCATNGYVNNANNNSSNNGINAQISQINLTDINQSMTSCMTTHSAFNLNGTNGSMQNIGPSSHRNMNSYQQFVQQQQQHQQQQVQQRQQHMLLQQQQRLQQRQQQQQHSQPQYSTVTNSTDNSSGNKLGANNRHSSGGASDNVVDRRLVFSQMKYTRPPSVREQDSQAVKRNQTQARHQQQQQQQHRQQSQHRPLPQQPEVTKVKVSDGVSGRNRMTSSGPGGEDVPDSTMAESRHSQLSDFSLTMDLKSPGSTNNAKAIVEADKVHHKVTVETAKVKDHSSDETRRMSGCSIMSGLSEVSMFSDLSQKIGNVSTRSMAMSEMSSVDNLDDMEEHDDENDSTDEIDAPYDVDGNDGAMPRQQGNRTIVTGFDGGEIQI